METMPQKRYYRQRAHCNPWSDHSLNYPVRPQDMDWSVLFSNEPSDTVHPEFADIGCGYGGLLIALSPMFPRTRMVGMEIRIKVSDFVMDRIRALRIAQPGDFGNVACLRTNAMKYLPNYFSRGQLKKLFFLFPDPHFKEKKHKWRIVSATLLAEYAFVLSVGGRVYTITDVREVHDWIVSHFEAHPLFRRLTDQEVAADPVTEKLFSSTEEGQKVTREGRPKFPALFERVTDPAETKGS